MAMEPKGRTVLKGKPKLLAAWRTLDQGKRKAIRQEGGPTVTQAATQQLSRIKQGSTAPGRKPVPGRVTPPKRGTPVKAKSVANPNPPKPSGKRYAGMEIRTKLGSRKHGPGRSSGGTGGGKYRIPV